HKTPASPVVHIRGLIDGVVEADLVEALQEFGPISYVVVMPKKRQALVEFEDILGACNAVNYAADNQIYIAGHPAFVNYSTSQKISRPGDTDDSRGVNNVLLFTILNPIYSITTDVLYTICNPCGPVQRIVIFRKNGVQAMLVGPLPNPPTPSSTSDPPTLNSSPTFDSVQSAQRAKASLNGADIYSGCCTLKIEYAKEHEVRNMNVTRPRNTDVTKPRNIKSGEHECHQPQEHEVRNMNVTKLRNINQGTQVPPSPGTQMSPDQGTRGDPGGNPNKRQRQPPLLGDHPADPVLMVYGLDQAKMNCDRVFNIFCLYGNVEKVKFMKSKPGAAMVEMADGYAVDRAITHLNNNFMFGQKLNVCVSKQQAIMPGQSYGLEDGSCSYKDFSGSRNNRFSTPEQAAKNRIQHPSNVLHFFNAPLEVTEDNFYEV
ncbi:Heterogeneous nuclear ribonucleoprotein L-like, partial [Calypte anna]